MGLGFLIYIKDLLLITATLILIAIKIKDLRLTKVQLALVVFLLYGLCLSVFNGIGFIQVFFSIKVLLPLLFGIMYHKYFILTFDIYKRLLFFLLILASFGVILNIFITYPWQGISTTIGGLEVDTSRSAVAAGGFMRFSGFSRSWSNTAIIILFGAIMFFVSNTSNKVIVLFIIILSFFSILLTTNKGITLAYLLVTFLFVFRSQIPSIFKKSVLFILMLCMILVPILIWNDMLNIDLGSGVFYILFHSLYVRFWEIWPHAYQLLLNEGNVLFGRGLGGFGAAQKYFESHLYNPADNLFIFLYGTFGIFGLCLLLFILIKTLMLDLKSSSNEFFFYVILSCMTFGLIGSVLENPIFGLFVGLSIGHLFTRFSYKFKTNQYSKSV